MVLFLLKLLFFTVSFISNLVTNLIFGTAARLAVLLIQGFRGSGQTIHGTLGQVTEVIRSCSEFFVSLVMQAIGAIISTLFDFVKESVIGSAGVTTSAIGGLLEKTKTSLDELLTYFAEVFEGLSDMVFTMVADLCNNYKDAIGYVTENA